MLYRHGRRLVDDLIVKSRLEKAQVAASQFANDLALYAASQTAFESVGWSFVVETSHFGLTVGLPKTKGLAMGAGIDGDDFAPLSVEGGEIEMVPEFTYF